MYTSSVCRRTLGIGVSSIGSQSEAVMEARTFVDDALFRPVLNDHGKRPHALIKLNVSLY